MSVAATNAGRIPAKKKETVNHISPRFEKWLDDAPVDLKSSPVSPPAATLPSVSCLPRIPSIEEFIPL